MVKTSQSPLVPLMAIRGVTQQEIADALGVRRETVSDWMRGVRSAKLSLGDWRKLADLLGVPIERMPDDLGPQPIHDTSLASSEPD